MFYSSIEELHHTVNNFYFIKRHLTLLIIGVVTFNIIKGEVRYNSHFSFFNVSVTVVLFWFNLWNSRWWK